MTLTSSNDCDDLTAAQMLSNIPLSPSNDDVNNNNNKYLKYTFNDTLLKILQEMKIMRKWVVSPINNY